MLIIPKVGQRFVRDFKVYLVTEIRLIERTSPFKENSFEIANRYNEFRSRVYCMNKQTKQITCITLHEYSSLVQNGYIVLTKSRQEDEQILIEAGVDMKRKVYFKDCHVNDVFRMDVNCPWISETSESYIVDSLNPLDRLRAKVVYIDENDHSIFIQIYINEEKNFSISGWVYEELGDLSIEDNLEFISKKKNNYW